MGGGIFAAIIFALLIAGCVAAIIAREALRQQRDHDPRRGLSNTDSASFHSSDLNQREQSRHD